MFDGPRTGKRFAWVVMYYLPLPWALYYSVVLIPFPGAQGWSLLYHQFPTPSYWVAYTVLLGAFCVLPWTIAKPLVRVVSKNWRDLFVKFWGYVFAVAGTLSWLLVLKLCGLLGTPLDGENLVFATLILFYVPPLWAPVIGALLQVRRGDGPLVRLTRTSRR
ncbi:MAG: hypothetical protein JRG70_12160 [Deltaproteobacteria bacterium]|nr:hypothetical protein [Deltaproteobacteria bacterium]